MSTAIAIPGNTADTILVHFFGGGLSDDRVIVERFRPARTETSSTPRRPGANARRKSRRVTATLKAVEEMRPACTEIIICTGLRTRGSQQLRSSIAAGLLCDRKQRG